MFICKFCNQERKSNKSLINHERLCKENENRQYTFLQLNKNKHIKKSNQYIKALELGIPKPIVSSETRKKFSNNNKSRHINRSKEEKLEIYTKISNTMKLRHEEGLAGCLNPVKKYVKTNKLCRLYVIKSNISNVEFIKIGITEKSITERFYKKLDRIEILFDSNLHDGFIISILEKGLHSLFKEHKVKIIEKFAGRTECFDCKIIDDLSKILLLIQSELTLTESMEHAIEFADL